MGFMLLQCALFILVVVWDGVCGHRGSLSLCFWPRDLEPHQKSMNLQLEAIEESETRTMLRPELRHALRLQRSG